MKALCALLLLAGLLTGRAAVADDQACKIDPAMKNLIESDSIQNFGSAYQSFLNTGDGRKWASSDDAKLGIGIPIDDIPVQLSGGSSGKNSGSWTHSLSQSEQVNVQQSIVSRIRKSVASSELWMAYMHCLDDNALASISLVLTPAGEDVAELDLKFTTQAPGTIPIPIILNVEVTGGRLTQTNWVGQPLSYGFVQQIIRDKGEELVVTVETSLQSKSATLDAIPVYDFAAILLPECDPCPPAPVPPWSIPFSPGGPAPVLIPLRGSAVTGNSPWDGSTCQGRFYEGWKFRLALEHLSPDDRTGGPLDVRNQYLRYRCAALYQKARQFAPPVSFAGESAGLFLQQQANYQADITANLSRIKTQMTALLNEAKVDKDTAMLSDQPELISPLQFYCKNPQMAYQPAYGQPFSPSQMPSGPNCASVSTWPPQGVDVVTESQTLDDASP
ncbi:hypothetical protein IHE49_15345 [Rhodanobacter sp. 7MK24]|uniref:hypothetical protein n=1 Tax=Rhodanobacter sp. 7MK24 TaxID=2775922 RepID=UPI00177E6693|nr:hypothetical protein [Rhodanobacter sp. 7MK24]MBD8881861.1 hypothetical protein [Rhodanobacter sp. 7MK24]